MIEVKNFTWGHEKISYHNGEKRTFWMPMLPDSNGCISVKFDVKNHGDKPVRKYRIIFKAYNGAGERVKCLIRHEDLPYIECADFLDAHQSRKGCVEKNLWYNKSIRSACIGGILVQYEDGKIETCEGNYVPTEEEKKTEKKEEVKAAIKTIIILLIIAGIFWAVYPLLKDWI